MGHIVNGEREYRLLQQRLDQNITGAPYSPVFIQILKLLFSPAEATIARQIPLRPTSVAALARKIGLHQEELQKKILIMAEKGLVFDFEYQGQSHVVLAPVVIGFFEFVYMRTREDLPMGELAQLFEEYMYCDDRFARAVFQENTQLGRALVQEEALPAGDYSEVLNWEKASHVIQSAKTVGLSLCACRHKASHLEKACNAPLKTCLTFNHGAEMLIKKGMAEQSSVSEAMAVLEQCKQAGLAQIADNVQRTVGFMCNCCGCCCGMIQAIKTFDLRSAVVTSNWVAHIAAEQCTGCGLCIKACPVDAIGLDEGSNARPKAVCEPSLCLGCGVCYSACKRGCISMNGREQQVMVPETTFDRMVAMAIERGKLSNFLFDDPSRLSHRALGRIASVIEKSAPVKAFMAIKPIRSVFLSALASGAKKYTER
ncbi:4Fe-4S dicluster domain-containing protein [Sporomusa sp.]|uniref:4Fe-4S dicluster domain-containing protein n=1 Tax=Sporomusa sp. TaxID=2078658 RepID=UPI002BC46406|nr:4Fe-4S dicluster domain-containing protein [Sporomusa sp.]HWR41678.1 4Fe-4S dicluster domain-containing protein [Sporomusa sp.]